MYVEQILIHQAWRGYMGGFHASTTPCWEHSVPVVRLRTTPDPLTFHHDCRLETISAPQKFDIQEDDASELGDWETAW